MLENDTLWRGTYLYGRMSRSRLIRSDSAAVVVVRTEGIGTNERGFNSPQSHILGRSVLQDGGRAFSACSQCACCRLGDFSRWWGYRQNKTLGNTRRKNERCRESLVPMLAPASAERPRHTDIIYTTTWSTVSVQDGENGKTSVQGTVQCGVGTRGTNSLPVFAHTFTLLLHHTRCATHRGQAARDSWWETWRNFARPQIRSLVLERIAGFLLIWMEPKLRMMNTWALWRPTQSWWSLQGSIRGQPRTLADEVQYRVIKLRTVSYLHMWAWHHLQYWFSSLVMYYDHSPAV